MVKKEKLRSKRYWLAALLLFLCTVLFCAAPAHAAKLNKTSLKITKGKSISDSFRDKDKAGLVDFK